MEMAVSDYVTATDTLGKGAMAGFTGVNDYLLYGHTACYGTF